MGKLPFMKFFPNDWISDTRCLSPEEKGAWIDLICYLWESPNRGQITYPIDSLGRMLGASREALDRLLKGLRFQGIAEITFDSHDNVTIMSRRIVREEKERESAKLRKQKERGHANVKEESHECHTTMSRQCHREKLEARSQKTENTNTKAAKDAPKEKKPKDEKLTFDEKRQLNEYCLKTQRRFQGRFNPFMWIQRNISLNHKCHLHVMKAMAEHQGIVDPWPYADSIARDENPNYNEKDSIAESNENKKLFIGLVESLRNLQSEKQKAVKNENLEV